MMNDNRGSDVMQEINPELNLLLVTLQVDLIYCDSANAQDFSSRYKSVISRINSRNGSMTSNCTVGSFVYALSLHLWMFIK
jgi:hypothetical protein